jgi:cytochrome c-type biogenesis protein CcmH/NrfG
MQRFARTLAFVFVLGFIATAHAETEARWRLGSEGQPHNGVPFTLVLGVAGFNDSAPELPKVEIAGATVTPMGAKPSIRQMMTEDGTGRQSIIKEVTWFLQYRVEVANPGKITIPTTTAVQGKQKATAPAAEVEVQSVPTTDLMKLELQLPNRPIYVGETIEAKLVLMVRAQPSNPEFSIPIANLDQFTVSSPPVTDRSKALEIDVGGKQLDLPYDQDATEAGGQKWSRFTLHLYIAPRQSGRVQVPGVSVTAGLPFGQPDVFGRYDQRMFRASDSAKTLDVKPLPETDKPASFAGAVGSQFAISVATSRSVVQLGEPVELAITVKSDQRLDNLALSKLDAEGELPRDKFQVPADPPTGELSADGKAKTFKVVVQVTGPATELPALAFSYFDPAKNTYQTIKSDPIALSVKAGSVIGANDVIAMAAKPGAQKPGAAGETELTLVGAELALSSPGDAGSKPLGGALLAGLLAALYLGSLGVLALVTWKNRTADQREEAAEVRAARKKVEAELARAERAPARDTAGPLAAALRGLARTLDGTAPACAGAAGPGRALSVDGTSADAVLARLETESFSRTAKDEPLSADLRQQVRDLVETWTKQAQRARHRTSAVAVTVLLAAIAAPSLARADAQSEGRAAYQAALGQSDASARKVAFTRAATSLAEAAELSPGHPELLADWGNAALGAGDVGGATLAYRRALAIDPSNARARRNLSWLRSRESDNLRPSAGTATETLFFFHDWPRGRRLLLGAVAFAIAVLLVVPWSGRRRRGLGLLAIIPAVAWLVLTISVVIEDRHASDVIVMDSVALRAADSAGAPAALVQPLPRGAELTVLEQRADWAKVQIASGTVGWVPTGAVQRVSR